MPGGPNPTRAGLANKLSRSPTSIFSATVGEDHQRSDHIEHSPRLSNRISHESMAETCPKNLSSGRQRNSNETGNNKPFTKRGHSPHPANHYRLLQPSFPSAKERGFLSPGNRSQSSKQIYCERTFPNGKSYVSKTHIKPKRLHGQTRPKRCLFDCGCPSRVAAVPTLYMAGPDIPISSPPLWPKHGPSNIHKTVKASSSLLSHSKYQTPPLLRQHSNHRVLCQNPTGTYSPSHRTTSKPRFHNQFREVGADSFNNSRVPRFPDQLKNNEILPTTGEDNESADFMQIPAPGEPNLLTPSFSTARFSRILPSSSLVCPTPLQKPSKLPNTTGSVQQGVVPRYGHPRCPGSGGTKMVDMEHQTGEWQSHLPTIGRNGCDFRRLQIGVGCYMRQSVHQRALVDSGECPPHQYTGAKGNVSGSANVSEAPVELISETSLRQYNGDSLYKQPGRDSFPYSHGSNMRSVELVPSTKHFDHGRTPSRDLEHSSRPGVTNIYRHERLEITTSIDTTIPEGKRHRSVCYKADQPVTTLCELAPRPSCSGHGRIFNKLEPSKRIRFPTIQPHTQDTDKGNERQCKSVTSSPGVANSALVATVATTHRPTSSAPTFKSVSSTGPIESQGNPSNVPETPISRMDYFQQLCSTAGLPKTATRLLASATRRSTNKTYDCAWTKWHSWCDRRKINPISATIKDILTFLSDQFDCNLQYRTVNVLRSAISSIHPWIEGKPVGQHPLVTRLMRGIANERPPKPRYSTTWDVSKVTTYLVAG